MQRLNVLFRNKAEKVENFEGGLISIDDLDDSGIGEAEKVKLENWVRGQLSGRHCMLALLESHHISKCENDSKAESPLTAGAIPRPLEFAMLSTSLSLPNDFLCDSGVLYEKIFSRPPREVTREALTMLTQKAMEKNITALRADQINIALKQMKIDNLAAPKKPPSGKSSPRSRSPRVAEDNDENAETHPNGADLGEDGEGEGDGEDPVQGDTVSPAVSALRHSILIELIRLHIKHTQGQRREVEISHFEHIKF